MKYRIGQLFTKGSDVYLLAQVGRNECCLIALHRDANRFSEPVSVVDSWNITPDEFDEISSGREFIAHEMMPRISWI